MPSAVRGTTIVLTLAVAALTAACGSDSTGPSGPTAASEALHLDTLWAAAEANVQTNSAYEGRVQLLTLLELPAAYGVKPSTFSVTTASGKQTWTGYVLEIEEGGDSIFANILYDDQNATNILYITKTYDAGVASDSTAELLAADTIGVDPSTGSISIARVGTGSGTTCTFQSGLQDTALANVSVGGSTTGCTPATFNTAINVTYTIPAGVEAALSSISYSNSRANGLLLVDESDPLRVPTRIRATGNIKAILQNLHTLYGRH